MTREELVTYAEELVGTSNYDHDGTRILDAEVINFVTTASTERFLGTGAEQYENPDGTQRFESESVERLIDGLWEEVIDAINYLVMVHIQAIKECDEGKCSIWVSYAPLLIKRQLEVAGTLYYVKMGQFRSY